MNNDFGKQLKQYRNRKGWSHSKLLEELKEEGYDFWSKSTVSKWEHGKLQPNENVIETLEEILETPEGLLLSSSGHSFGARGQAIGDIIAQAGRETDKEVFEKSNKILNEKDFDKLFESLKHNYFYDSQLTAILGNLEFFQNEGNKFAGWHLNYLCLRVYQGLYALSEFIQVNSIERSLVAGYYANHSANSKNKDFNELLKNLLDNSPIPNYDISPLDECYLILDKHSHLQIMTPEIDDIFTYQSYSEWQREFDRLVSTCENTYKEYRAAIRDTLFL
jgi:transcriptional regulator with XRE-family HTH domain